MIEVCIRWYGDAARLGAEHQSRLKIDGTQGVCGTQAASLQ
jgi:hypothetical protein